MVTEDDERRQAFARYFRDRGRSCQSTQFTTVTVVGDSV